MELFFSQKGIFHGRHWLKSGGDSCKLVHVLWIITWRVDLSNGQKEELLLLKGIGRHFCKALPVTGLSFLR